MVGGEALLGLPTVIQFPMYENEQQYFPFRTLIMLLTLATHLSVSWFSQRCFTSGWLDSRFDVLRCFSEGESSPCLPTAEPTNISLQPVNCKMDGEINY